MSRWGAVARGLYFDTGVLRPRALLTKALCTRQHRLPAHLDRPGRAP